MAANLIALLQNEFSDDAISTVGSFLGEAPASTKAALGYTLPAIVSALTRKAQTSEGAADLFGMLQRGGFDRSGAGNALGLLKSASGIPDLVKTGGGLVASLFGARRASLTDWVSGATGLSAQSSASLFSVAVPVVLGVLGRAAASAGGFNASSITKFLGEQRAFLRSVAPPGLDAVLESTAVPEPARASASQPVRMAGTPAWAYEQPEDRGGPGWLKWALPLLLLGLIVWGVSSWRSQVPANTALNAPSGPGLASPLLMKRTLSCGQELDIAPNGVEASLIGFIEDPNRAADKEVWFTFDRLAFETGSATLQPSSTAQLRNIADILNCYPNVNVKVGGYTDNVGEPASNLRLSQARADNTRQAVLANGIDRARVEAEGYGEQHPVASNDTDAGRQRNRRIDLRVTRK